MLAHMKHISGLAASIASIAVLAICSLQVNAAERGSDADAIQLEGHIEFFPADSSENISGLFEHAGSIIYFQSHRTTVGKESGPPVTPDKVNVRVEVNGLILNHEIDYAAQTMTMNGYGAMLYPDHVRVLRAFYSVLEKTLYGPLSDNKKTIDEVEISRPAGALYRIATMYSEVPIGTVLDERVVTPHSDVELYGTPDLSAEPAPQQCQVNSGEGIRRYSGAVCTELRRARQDHDARLHCISGTDEYIGCKQATCKARCGIGCGVGGRGVYTKDCNDHDWCVYYHPEGGAPANPSHNDCGDEWFDAVNDFGTPFPLWQCRGACR